MKPYSTQSMKNRHVSKVIDVFQRTCSCLLDTWKKKHQVPITSLSLHWAIYWHKPVYIFAGQGCSLLLNMLNVHIIYYYICFPLCAHVTPPSHWTGLEPGMPAREAGALPRRLKATTSNPYWHTSVTLTYYILIQLNSQ